MGKIGIGEGGINNVGEKIIFIWELVRNKIKDRGILNAEEEGRDEVDRN